MENTELKNILDRFFENETQKILVLKGRWGVGKTYFWENFIKMKREKEQNFYSLNAYSYASLFGVSNLSELQNKILISTEILNEFGYTEIIKKQNKNINRFIKGFFNIPFIKNNVYDFSPFLHNMIQSQLICFDDLERCHENFSIETLMGYADELVQKRKCKVIIIFNEEQLSPTIKAKFDFYREKIVDIEVTHMPSSEHNFDVAFEGTTLEDDWKNVVRERCLLLKIDNIRVLKKIRFALENYRDYTKEYGFPDIVRNTFIQRLASFYVLYLEEKEERYSNIKEKIFAGTILIPDIRDDLQSSFMDKEKTKTPEEENNLLQILLSKYHLKYSFMFDKDFIFYINNGYISSRFIDSKVESEIWYEKLQNEEKALKCKKEVSKVWELYHSTLQDNIDDIIDILDDLIEDENIFNYLNIQDFFQFIKNFCFFKKLKHSEYKVESVYSYIDKYIDKNNQTFLHDDKNLIIISIEFTSFVAQGREDCIIDGYAREQINKLRSGQYQSVETWDILKKVYEAGYATPEEKQLLESITKDQYIELFEKHEEPELTRIVRQVYGELESSDKRYELEAALDEISQKSNINAHRIAALKKIH